jgi:hypothetical protein
MHRNSQLRRIAPCIPTEWTRMDERLLLCIYIPAEIGPESGSARRDRRCAYGAKGRDRSPISSRPQSGEQEWFLIFLIAVLVALDPWAVARLARHILWSGFG